MTGQSHRDLALFARERYQRPAFLVGTMLFTQISFIFVFLPVSLFGYFWLARCVRNPLVPILWLAAASLVFCAYQKISFLPVILISMAFNYAMSHVIAAQSQGRRRTAAFAVAIAANLLALAYYKYLNFGIALIRDFTGAHLSNRSIVLPLGISFYTFTQLAYLADVYGGYAIERSVSKYLLFVTYFPHLIAGPILHHSEMMPQFAAPEARRFSAERFAIALTVFGIGLFKKIVIADGFSLIATPVFQLANTGVVAAMDAWGGALAYSLQIYFDFSGYCDMAIALSLMFGIVLPFNFNSPYKSRSIAEFWRRWHITLSRFLRDYLYIPLGGNRHGNARRNINLAVTMLLGGLWHGASWTFVLWGGLHGLYLVINQVWGTITRRSSMLTRLAGTTSYAIFCLLLTQVAVVVGWVFFRADRIAAGERILAAMFGAGPAPPANYATIVRATDLWLIAFGYFICMALPNVNTMFEHWNIGIDTYNTPRAWSILELKWAPQPGWAVVAAMLLLVGLIISAVVGAGSPFLYYQF
jgi:alginate O-acetyltransferase complex protein AlgI